MINLFALENETVKVAWNLFSEIKGRIGADETVSAWLFVAGVALCIIVPYLLGSINPAILFSKLFYHEDIRSYGSGNAGSTNVLRTYGKKMAILTFVCDLLKAAISVSFGALLLTNEIGGAIAGFFVIFGHSFPVFHKFKGGKGVACAAVVILMMDWISFIILFATFIGVVLISKMVSMGSVSALFLYPIVLTAFTGERGGAKPLFAVLTAILVIFMHRENLKRIYNGEESKLSFKKTDKHKVGEASGQSDGEMPNELAEQTENTEEIPSDDE